MSDPPLWLPPLNSHKNYKVLVHASETQIPPSELQFTKIQRPIFVINLTVAASYSTPDEIIDDVDNYDFLPILALNKTLEIDRNPKTLITSLTDDILSADLVPFQLDRCSWDIHHDDNNPPQYVFLVDEEEVYVKLFEFLCNLIENPNNAKHNILGVKLEIHKLVNVPRDEFWSWKSYYIEKTLICPWREEFITRSRRYLEAIRRPRSEIELFEETLSLMMYKPASRGSMEELESVIYDDDEDYNCGYAKSCCICLEGFLNGSRVTRLPCLHVFHGDHCVVRWLSVNHICPLCRYQLPTDDDDGHDDDDE